MSDDTKLSPDAAARLRYALAVSGVQQMHSDLLADLRAYVRNFMHYKQLSVAPSPREETPND